MGTRVPGSYLLLLELRETATLRVGKLGTFSFPAGWYVYVGSALGGLDQRISRHLRPSAVRRWHVDYLRAEAFVREVARFSGIERRECDLARSVLALPGAAIPVSRFGASDCRCAAHLVHFRERPLLSSLVRPTGCSREDNRENRLGEDSK